MACDPAVVALPTAFRPTPVAGAAGVFLATVPVRTREARDAEGTSVRGIETEAGAVWPPTWGQPWKATNALASTNMSAAPANSEPDVPNPARYARVARTLSP